MPQQVNALLNSTDKKKFAAVSKADAAHIRSRTKLEQENNLNINKSTSLLKKPHLVRHNKETGQLEE